MSALLELKDLSKTYRSRDISGAKNEVRALDRVDLSVWPGEHLSIVGGSGCGKTTLAKVVTGLVSPDAGQIIFQEKEVSTDANALRDFRRKVRMVFQDPFASLDPRFTVRAILKEALCLEPRLKRSAQEDKMKAVLGSVGLPEDILSRYPHEFSGGERQRIAIARALMTDPALLILDEAVSSVDVLVQKKILDLLAEIQSRMSITYIFISHNLRAVRKVSRKIAVMREGRIVEYGTVSDIFERPAHDYTQQLLRAAVDYRCEAVESVAPSRSGMLQDIGSGHLVLS
jgi:ABC-type glutathione transport system ATPase component